MKRTATNFLVGRIENCLEKIPEGHDKIKLQGLPYETGIDKTVSWCNEPDSTGITLKRASETFLCTTNINIFRQEDRLVKIRFHEQESQFSETIQKLDPIEFEGTIDKLGIRKLGKVASTLSEAVKVIESSQRSKQT